VVKFRYFGLLAGAVLLAGCSGGGDDKSASAGGSGGSTASSGKKLKVGIVFDSGGRGDKSFNDSAYAGIQRAVKEFGVEEKDVDSKTEKDYETNLSGLAEAGCDVIFAVGFAQKNALTSVAPKYPNIKFAIIDDVLDAPNVSSLVFSEEQGSFLAGYLAALVSKSGKLGFVGGKTTPLIKKFETGYIAGAKTAKPSIDTTGVKYTESWDDTGAGKAAATVLFNGGCDIVFHAAGRCGMGVIGAAKDQGKFAIGVDSDQDDQAPGSVLTSMVKHVDEAVFQTIKDVKDNSFKAGTKQFDLKSKGVGLTEFKYTKDKIGDANIKQVNDISQQISDGKIVVPTKPEDLPAYLAKLKK
jgi:basic membrane protein A